MSPRINISEDKVKVEVQEDRVVLKTANQPVRIAKETRPVRVIKSSLGAPGATGPAGPAGTTGQMGPAGAPGEDANYVHDQTIPADVWEIEHDLNKMPSVFAVDSAGTVQQGDIVYIDTNHLTVSFGVSFGGKAYLN